MRRKLAAVLVAVVILTVPAGGSYAAPRSGGEPTLGALSWVDGIGQFLVETGVFDEETWSSLLSTVLQCH